MLNITGEFWDQDTFIYSYVGCLLPSRVCRYHEEEIEKTVRTDVNSYLRCISVIKEFYHD